MFRIVGFVFRFVVVDLVLAMFARPAMVLLENAIIGMI